MSSVNTKNYHKQGGEVWVVGGKIVPATEVQAAHIADATDLATALTRISAILVALEDVGITAAS